MAPEGRVNVRLLTATAWATLVFFAVTSSLLSVCLKLMGHEFGIGLELKGALAAARACAVAISGVLSGYLADRIGKRHLLSGAMVVMAAGMLATARCTSYAQLVAAMMVMGVGLGSTEALISPLVAELHPRAIATHLNLLHAFYPTGLAVSAGVVALVLESGASWRTPFTVAVVPVVALGAIYLAGRFPESAIRRRRPRLSVPRILRNPTFWLLGVCMMLGAGGEGSLIYWAPHYVQSTYGASVVVGGSMLIVFGVGMALSRFAISGAVRRFRVGSLMVGMAFLATGVTLALVLVNSLAVTIALMALAGVFGAAFWPCVLSLATEKIATGSTVLLAMLTVAGTLGFGIHPWLVGVVARAVHDDLRAGIALIPISFGLAGLVLIPLLRRSAPAHDAQTG